MEKQDVAVLRDGARLIGVLPYIDAELEKMEKALETRVYSMMTAKTLTPDAAYLAWSEKAAIRSLRSRFKQRVEVVQSVGAAHAAELER